jgi:arginine/ornithine transport system substrate-binding protein
MKKSFALYLLVASAVAAKAQPHEITIAMDATYPPFAYTDGAGKLVGFEVDLANALCEEIRMKCHLVNVGWDGLITGLMARKHDALMTSMNITEERRKVIDFSQPYYHMQNRFVAKKGVAITISKDGLRGKTIAVQRATAQDKFATEQWGDVARIVRYPGANEPYLDLLNGRADLHFGFIVQINDGFLAKDGNDKNFALLGPTYTGKDSKLLGEGVAIGLRKNSDALRETFNKGLAALKAKGIFKKINDSYFSFDLSADK